MVAAGALYKVVVDALCQKGEQFYATCRLLTDTDEPDDEIRKAMLTEIKKAIHEISSHFQGSEHFTLPIDRMRLNRPDNRICHAVHPRIRA